MTRPQLSGETSRKGPLSLGDGKSRTELLWIPPLVSLQSVLSLSLLLKLFFIISFKQLVYSVFLSSLCLRLAELLYSVN